MRNQDFSLMNTSRSVIEWNLDDTVHQYMFVQLGCKVLTGVVLHLCQVRINSYFVSSSGWPQQLSASVMTGVERKKKLGIRYTGDRDIAPNTVWCYYDVANIFQNTVRCCYNMVQWYCIEDNSDWSKACIRVNTHNRHPIARTYGQAMGCLVHPGVRDKRRVSEIDLSQPRHETAFWWCHNGPVTSQLTDPIKWPNYPFEVIRIYVHINTCNKESLTQRCLRSTNIQLCLLFLYICIWFES